VPSSKNRFSVFVRPNKTRARFFVNKRPTDHAVARVWQATSRAVARKRGNAETVGRRTAGCRGDGNPQEITISVLSRKPSGQVCAGIGR